MEATVTIVKEAQPAVKNTEPPPKRNAEPHYIGDDEKEMAFGPVKKNPNKTQVPPVRRGANGRGPGNVSLPAVGYVPGSYGALPVVPRAEEPIASAMKRGRSHAITVELIATSSAATSNAGATAPETGASRACAARSAVESPNSVTTTASMRR